MFLEYLGQAPPAIHIFADTALEAAEFAAYFFVADGAIANLRLRRLALREGGEAEERDGGRGRVRRGVTL